jgi:hypothetical protein
MIAPCQAGRKGRPVRLNEERPAVWRSRNDEFVHRPLTDVAKDQYLSRQAKLGAALDRRRELGRSFASDGRLRHRRTASCGRNKGPASTLQILVASLSKAADFCVCRKCLPNVPAARKPTAGRAAR